MKICAVLPAAGRGSRLGLQQPKLLVPVTERDTIWSLLRARLEGLVDHVHLIVSPVDREAFLRAVEEQPSQLPVSVGIQARPKGMGDAIFCGHEIWSQAQVVLVVWGDQVHVSRDTLERALRLHQGADRRVVLPLVASPDAYVEYLFDQAERLVTVRQSREGERCRPGGWSDVGAFILSTRDLRREWSAFLRVSRGGRPGGALTGEINFLPFLVFLSQRNWEIKPLCAADALEARGINTPADLEFFRALYAQRDLSTESTARAAR